MSTVRWTVRSDPTDSGWHCWFYVYIYDTVEELRRAARKYREYGGPEFDDTMACFQPRFTVRYEKHPKYKKGKPTRCANTAFIGVMRFCRESLVPHIVIHESVHAATHYVCALKLTPSYNLGCDIINEEALAHATHEFSYSLLKKAELL